MRCVWSKHREITNSLPWHYGYLLTLIHSRCRLTQRSYLWTNSHPPSTFCLLFFFRVGDVLVRHQKTPVEKKPLPFSSMAINANWRICWVIRLLFLWLLHPVLLWSTTFSSIGFCPPYDFQATHPDSRNMEVSVLFTILITLYLSHNKFK